MSDNRYNRWQGLAIAQFSVAVALISALSIAGMGAGLSLLQKDDFMLNGCDRQTVEHLPNPVNAKPGP